jgi:adenine-specific DNA-methyltransferase
MARTWSEQVEPRRRQSAACSFMAASVTAYLEATGGRNGISPHLSPIPVAMTYSLDDAASALARNLGWSAAELPLEVACFQLSACYTAMLPGDIRSAWGAYYTPPALTDRLLTMAADAGVDWSTARVLDPACGGGAFLLPVALLMRKALPELRAAELIAHLSVHLRGLEIDPFAAWLTQAWLDIAFAEELEEAGGSFPQVVKVADSLREPVEEPLFDLVVGNPPYGRVTLPADLREHYRRGLYGHANLYGLFTDLAVRWTRKGGVVAYVTPTSFFAGEYFKALRQLLASEAPPVAVDFITARRGVFDDVLQEALLATYLRGSKRRQADVHFLELEATGAEITHAGRFKLPDHASEPWLAPRTPGQQALVGALSRMPTRLSDLGYQVSTGPLVWNRFKPQFRAKSGPGLLPVIWAEAITSDGTFVFRAEKRDHQPYFKPASGDGWLQTSQSCVLLQRTTAKEQNRRLIAAELPAAFLAKHGPVIVENHLNMVRPIGVPTISAATIAVLLNSPVADAAFRCISGSVAVSAFELEALPLPTLADMEVIDAMVRNGKPIAKIHAALARLYESPTA